MCPACIGTATLSVAGAISTGGLATLIRLKFRAPTGASAHAPVDHALINHEPMNHNREQGEQNDPKNRVTS